EDLSNWYVRRSRRRFWEADAAAFATLRSCLLTLAKLLAPFCPFIADEIYDNLDGSLASVHLCEFPALPADEAASERDERLEQAMGIARETVRLGLGARAKAKVKLRQPLAEAVVVAHGRERDAIEILADTVREELNVRNVRFVAAADELGSYEVKANYRTLGPLFGKDMPLAAQAIASLDPARVVAAVREAHAAGDLRAQPGGDSAHGTPDAAIGITVAGREHILSPDDVIVTMRAPDGYSVEREGAHAVAMDTSIDDDLRQEGYARELVHAVQNARRSAGLAVEDRIELRLEGDAELLSAVEAHRDYVGGETLALQLKLGGQDEGSGASAYGYSEQCDIEGR